MIGSICFILMNMELIIHFYRRHLFQYNPYPVDYVAMFYMPILIEKYYGRYIDDVDDPQRCISYWNKMMEDNNAEASFKSRRK